MSPLIATILVIIGIISLFVLDRNSKARTSKALWIPVIYLLLIGSRPVSEWLDLDPPETINGVYSSPIDAAVNFGLLALGLITLITRRKQVGLLLQRSGLLVLFYVYAGLSMLWSDLPSVTLKHWVKAVEDVMMALIVLTDGDPVMAVKRLLKRAGFILIPLSHLAIRYYPTIGRGFNKSWESVVQGVTGTKNELGVICLIFGLGSLWCLLGAYRDPKSAARSRHLLVHSIMLGTIVLLLQTSHSATASVCFMLAGSVMVAESRLSAGARAASVHFPVAVVLCIALVPLFVAPSLVESVGRDSTFSGRTEIWHILPRLVRNPWIGAGYETFLVGPRLVTLKAIIDQTFQEAHEGYLEVWLNLGWVGVSLFFLMLIAGYKKIVAAVQLDPVVSSIRLAFFVAVIIEGMTEASFRMMSPTCFVLLWAMIGPSKTGPARPSMDGRRVRGTEVVLGVRQRESAVTP